MSSAQDGRPDRARSVAGDATLEALDELVAVGRDNVVAWMGVMARVEVIRRLRLSGVPYTTMSIPEGERIIDAVSANQQRLAQAAARFRQASMLELRAEGWSTGEIARAFGITRQRVSVILSGFAEPTAPTATDIDA
jgi:hypothetical protein